MGVVRRWLVTSATVTLTLLAGCTGAASGPSASIGTGGISDSAAVVPGTPNIPDTSPSPPPSSGSILPGASASPASTPNPASTSASASTDSTTSPQASTLDPIVVEPTQTEVTATVGRKLAFNVGPHPGLWRITSGNEAIVGELSHGQEVGDAKSRPGAKALGVGNVTVTLENADGHEPLVYMITVIQ